MRNRSRGPGHLLHGALRVKTKIFFLPLNSILPHIPLTPLTCPHFPGQAEPWVHFGYICLQRMFLRNLYPSTLGSSLSQEVVGSQKLSDSCSDFPSIPLGLVEGRQAEEHSQSAHATTPAHFLPNQSDP